MTIHEAKTHLSRLIAAVERGEEVVIARSDKPVVRPRRLSLTSQDLPFHHRDPFDRMIIAQALNGNFTVIGTDKVFDDYGVKRIW